MISKKPATIFAAVFIAHFILTFATLFIAFGMTMHDFDNPAKDAATGAVRQVVADISMGIFTVLSLPLVFILQQVLPPQSLPGLAGYIPFIGNSLLWAAGITLGITKLGTKKQHKEK